MIIKMNTLAEKAKEDTNGFNLFRTIQANASAMKKEKNPVVINNLVVDCKENFTNAKFNALLELIYRTYDIDYKVVETTATSNKAFLDEDDYFELYSEVLWNCIRTYNPNKGDFKNYFIMNFRVTFLQEKKCSYFKVTGYIEPEKRDKKSIVRFNDLDDALGNFSKDISSFENQDLIERCLSCLNENERKVVNCLFFSTDEPIKTPQVAEILNMPLKKVRYHKRKAYEKIKRYYPDALNDFVGNNNKSEKIISFANPNSESGVDASLEKVS